MIITMKTYRIVNSYLKGCVPGSDDRAIFHDRLCGLLENHLDIKHEKWSTTMVYNNINAAADYNPDTRLRCPSNVLANFSQDVF